jgi:hypothetical protein
VGEKFMGEKNQTYIWGRSFFFIKIIAFEEYSPGCGVHGLISISYYY